MWTDRGKLLRDQASRDQAHALRQVRPRGLYSLWAIGEADSIVRVLMRGGRLLATPFAVAVCGQGVLLGLVVLARLVVSNRLQVVVSGGGVMGGGLEMVLNRGVRDRCCHRSSLLGVVDLGLFVPGQMVSQLELV